MSHLFCYMIALSWTCKFAGKMHSSSSFMRLPEDPLFWSKQRAVNHGDLIVFTELGHCQDGNNWVKEDVGEAAKHSNGQEIPNALIEWCSAANTTITTMILTMMWQCQEEEPIMPDIEESTATSSPLLPPLSDSQTEAVGLTVERLADWQGWWELFSNPQARKG